MTTRATTKRQPADLFCGAVYRKGSNEPATCRLDRGHRGGHSTERPSERAMAVHRVKSWPEQFRAVVTGRKRFEMRRDDRNYQPGDTIELIEFAPDLHQLQLVKTDGVTGRVTGRSWMGVIGYVSRGGPLPAGWCAFDLISVEDLNRVEGVRR